MNASTHTTYRVVEMDRTRGQGQGEIILFGILLPTETQLTTPADQVPTQIFCLSFGKKGWEFLMNHHYNPDVIRKVSENGAEMGLLGMIKIAQSHASNKYPNG